MTSNCALCSRQAVKERVIFEDEHWLVRHSMETDIVGYFLIESRRHFLDLSEANAAERAGYGELLADLTAALREVLDCQRVYTFTLAEVVPHFHAHVIPRGAALPKAYRGRGIMSYPTSGKADDGLADEVCSRAARALKRMRQRQGLSTSAVRMC
jgi:diadenosine tetraphosphate (Ap4A) HIT family hydrolase